MALIGKIRSNMWVVFVIIALATLSFILMDAQGPGGGAVTDTTIGVVNGKKIDYTEFQRTESILLGNSGQDPLLARAGLWDYFVEKSLIENESDALGMGVSKNELLELQFGQNLSPVIAQRFRNQTGQVDIAQLTQIKNQIQNGTFPAESRMFWAETEKQVVSTQLSTKLNNMVQKAIFTPTWMAEENYKLENSSVDLEVVKIPFADIPAGDISVSDADLAKYIKNHAADFERKEEARKIKFVVMDVIPNKQDSMHWRTQMEAKIAEFQTTDSDSLFAFTNKGSYVNYYMKSEEMPEDVRNVASTLNIGEVYGPYVVQNARSLQAAKLLDRKVVPDSVSASHILISATPGDDAQIERADFLVDSLMTAVKRGSSFSDLASRFSDDTSNKTIGGDLGTFVQGRMVQEFNDVCFLTGREGGVYKVRTQFGVHLLKITDRIFNDRTPKYKLAFINMPIIPRKETQEALYSSMVDLVGEYSYIDGLAERVEGVANLEMVESEAFEVNDYNLNVLGSGNVTREMIKFAFNPDTEVGDLSPDVYTYTDNVLYYQNRYVIAGLSQVLEPGLSSPTDVRDQIETTVLNMKKGEAYAKGISGKDLAAIASGASVEMDTVLNIAMNSTLVPGIGNEPKVLGAASQLAQGATSSVLVGNSGVFVVRKMAEKVASDPVAVDFMKSSATSKSRLAKDFRIMGAIKEKSKIKDNRNTFF